MAKQIALVLGAGASADFGMPVGSKLKEQIINKCRTVHFDHTDSVREISQYVRDVQFLDDEPDIMARVMRYEGAARTIKEGLPFAASIDDFIRVRATDADIVSLGKILIAECLSESERLSCIGYRTNYFPGSGEPFRDVGKASGSWLSYLFQYMTKQRNAADIWANFSFVNFNYDRCLEHFSLHAVQQLYGADRSTAKLSVRRMSAVRPYGSLGEWDYDSSAYATCFGGGPQGLVRSTQSRILTYSESVDQSIPSRIGELLYEAQIVIFLGFAFHEQNMSLFPVCKSGIHKEIYFTTRGLSDADVTQVLKILGNRFPMMTRHFTSESCAGLFQEYTRQIFSGN